MDSISKSFLIFLSFVLVFHLNSQPSITWQRIYDGPEHRSDVSRDICMSTDGNYYIAGWTARTGIGAQIYVLKINQIGDTLWTKVFASGSDGPLAHAVGPSNDGGCVVTGRQDSSFVLKLSSIGSLMWWKYYGGTERECYDIKRTSDGGYVVCGCEIPGIQFRGYVLRIDPDGTLRWQRIYSNAYDLSFNSIVEISGGFVVCGSKVAYPSDTSRAYVAKLDMLGEIVWERSYLIDNKWGGARSISITNSGYLIGGEVAWNVSIESFFIKTDFDGNLYFTKLFPPPRSHEEFGAIQVINNNRYVISFTRDTTGFPIPYRVRNIITDSIGNVIYEKFFSNGGEDKFHSVLPLNNGDIIFTGWTEPRGGNYTDIYTIRTDSMLNAPPIGIAPISNEIPGEFALYQNYPNPFNNKTIINFSVDIPSGQLSIFNFVRLIVYDVLGREIETLVNEELKPGKYQIQCDASNYPSGVYFLTLYTSSNIFVRKMILIK